MRVRDFGPYTPGVGLCMQTLESWLYGGQPEANLQVGDLFDSLRVKMREGYFEDLLRRIFLQNPHKAKAVLTPSHTAGEARRQAEAERLTRGGRGLDPSRPRRVAARAAGTGRLAADAGQPRGAGHAALPDLG